IFSSDGSRLFMEAGKEITVWQAGTGERLGSHQLPNGEHSLSAISGDGRTLLVEDKSGKQLKYLDAVSGKAAAGPELQGEFLGGSPNGQFILISKQDVFELRQFASQSVAQIFDVSSRSAVSVALTTSASTVAIADDNGLIIARDAKSWTKSGECRL